MARYTNSLKAAGPIQVVQQSVASILGACDMDLIHSTKDYVVAKERPGHVTYSKLTMVEVLIDGVAADEAIEEDASTLTIIVKNEELPLSRDNHCQKVFDAVHQALTSNLQFAA